MAHFEEIKKKLQQNLFAHNILNDPVIDPTRINPNVEPATRFTRTRPTRVQFLGRKGYILYTRGFIWVRGLHPNPPKPARCPPLHISLLPPLTSTGAGRYNKFVYILFFWFLWIMFIFLSFCYFLYPFVSMIWISFMLYTFVSLIRFCLFVL